MLKSELQIGKTNSESSGAAGIEERGEWENGCGKAWKATLTDSNGSLT